MRVALNSMALNACETERSRHVVLCFGLSGIALVAGVLGFGVVAFAAAEIARICFFIFIVLFLFSLIAHLFRRTSIP
jgi:uncharacterized membrane protein YtjA (UPF0391 family)